MEFTPAIHRKLYLAAIVFGLALSAVLSWTTFLAPAQSLANIPIDSASYGLNLNALAIIIAINVIGITAGSFLVARFWEQVWAAILAGGVAAALVQVITAYLVKTASLENNSYAELILFNLPVALLIGGAIWFLGGMLGSLLERLALQGAANLFQRPGAAQLLGWLLVIIVGAGLGYAAGGSGEQREDSVAAARALQGAVTLANNEPLDQSTMPAGFRVSDPALGTLQSYGERLRQPYRISFVDYDGREVVTRVRFADGLAVRCVSVRAHISRCFEEQPLP